MVIYDKIILYYLLFGLIFTGILALVIGILSSFLISLFIAFLYFSLLILLIAKIRKMSTYMNLKLHFNLSLILRNENERLYNKYNIKARPGYLSKWIEFHWANPYCEAIP